MSPQTGFSEGETEEPRNRSRVAGITGVVGVIGFPESTGRLRRPTLMDLMGTLGLLATGCLFWGSTADAKKSRDYAVQARALLRPWRPRKHWWEVFPH